MYENLKQYKELLELLVLAATLGIDVFVLVMVLEFCMHQCLDRFIVVRHWLLPAKDEN
ncbi:hypothetical protein [Tumebacillus flagellatus]|uniref:hypothetical protein n=1 Tax=Tumebacillus flagellatus TaxID=1157490 RepID=UPI001377A50E|nr:hypothetical protein [Tumebacillus flagellatus]